MIIYFNGLMLGFSLIMALGPQNIFLIRQGALRKHALLAVIICFCCDALLISVSIIGLNHLLARHPFFQMSVVVFGVLFLVYYGINALKRGLFVSSLKCHLTLQTSSRFQIILLALGFSLLNPQAIIDSLIIIGGGSTQFAEHQYVFLSGVVTASLIWFFSLTFTAYYFSKLLTHTRVWRHIELSSGLMMLVASFKLAMALPIRL